MTYKKILAITVIIILALAVYAQVEIEDFLNLKGVKVTLGDSKIESVEQEGNKLFVEINGKIIEIEKGDKKYVDVTSEDCSKLGFVYMPGYEYDFMNETSLYEQGWALGIAYSRNDNFEESLEEMTLFVDTAHKNNLKPIIRILGNNWQEKVMPSETVIKFIQSLEQSTNNEFYVQIWDKPNVNFGEEITPEEYSDYVSEIEKETEVRIISGSLSQGSSRIGDYNRTPSEKYLDELLEIDEFWDSIDYWGSNLYNPGERDACINVTEIDFYDGQRVCTNTNYNYRYELEKIKRETGKDFQVILTEVGYPNPEDNTFKIRELLEQVKADPLVKSGTIFTANGWDFWESSSWLNENKTFKPFVFEFSGMCTN